MKKILFTFIWLAWSTACLAQNDLNIGEAFSRYGKSKGCKMVELHNYTVKGYRLDTYKSLEFLRFKSEIEALLQKDRNNAKKVQEVINNGTLLGGYYIMPRVNNSANRYILYRKGAAKQASVVVYMEGNIDADDLMKITRK